jgi:hypothetical protein
VGERGGEAITAIIHIIEMEILPRVFRHLDVRTLREM